MQKLLRFLKTLAFNDVQLKILFFLVLAALFSIYDLAIRAPIFTDEIGYKILNARYFLDNHISITTFPQCTPNFSNQRPIIFLPFSYLESLLYEDLTKLLKLRVGSTVYLIISFYLFFLVTHLCLKEIPGWNRIKSFLWVVCLNSLGLCPFFMILNRPELPMLIFLLVMTLIFLKLSTKASHTLMVKLFLKTGYFISLLGICFFHPKALFFTPLFLIVSYFIFENLSSKITSAFVVLYIVFQHFVFVNRHLACPSDEQVNQVLNGVAVFKLSSIDSLIVTISQLLKNFFSSRELIKSVVFTGGHALSYFPSLGENGIIQDPTQAFSFKIWNYSYYLLITLFLVQLIRGLLICLQPNRYSLYRKPKIAYFSGLLIAWLALCSFTTRKTFYDNTLILPLFFLSSIFSIQLLPDKSKSFVVKTFFTSTIILFFTSTILFVSSYSQFRTVFEKGGQIDSILFGVSGFRSEQHNSRVKSLALKCGIDPNSTLSHLVVDELSYPAFWKSVRQPYFALFLFWLKSNAGDNGIHLFLQSRGSSGFIGSCRYLYGDLLQRATKDQELCCLPRFN